MSNVVSFKPKISAEKTNTCIVIPARLASTRFPKKMLQEVIPGVTLIEYVYNQCQQAHNANDVYVVTDSQTVADMFGDKAFMSSRLLENGTARVASIIDVLDYENIINVQGDMITFPRHVIKDVTELLERGEDVVTVCKEMAKEDSHNPNTVKCINNGRDAHWFLRASVPYGDWHMGIYGYSKRALATYPYLRKYAEENLESLEKIRWIQNGINVSITYTDGVAAEINTEEDLSNWQQTQ